MSSYVLSDLHGQYALFEKMLGKIQFNENDTLYMLGDAIDRGKDGIAILQKIMTMENCVFLLGNHEKMMLDVYVGGDVSPYEAERRWHRNGCAVTIEAYNQLDQTDQTKLLAFLKQAPLQLDITVNDHDYRLVHGAPCLLSKEEYERTRGGSGLTYEEAFVWTRIGIDEVFEGPTVIVGHTPTPLITHQRPPMIWHGNNVIDIDCGCAMAQSGGRLGCLRLDDGEEFYVSLEEIEADKKS